MWNLFVLYFNKQNKPNDHIIHLTLLLLIDSNRKKSNILNYRFFLHETVKTWQV